MQPESSGTSAIKFLSSSEEMFFDTDSYIESVGEEDISHTSPGAFTNSHRKYLSLLFIDCETREVSRCCEYDLLYDITGLSTEEEEKFLEKALSTIVEQDSLSITIESLKNTFQQCIDIGYSHQEAVSQLLKVVDEKHSGDDNLKNLIIKEYEQE